MNQEESSGLFSYPKRVRILLGLLGLAVIALGIRVMTYEEPPFELLMSQPIVNHVYNDGSMITEKDGKNWLYGGGRPMEKDFDVTTLSLDPRQFHYGIGREHFPALIEPEFVPPKETRDWLDAKERVLAVKVGDEVKVYPIKLLVYHEVVNDVVGGKPICAAYCYLADLGAVYDRSIGGKEFTFALSGYTYFDPEVWEGRDAFVFWDRETESLWWPPIGKAVSGPMNGVVLNILNPTLWSQTTLGEVLKAYPDAKILKAPQPYEPPETWIAYSEEEIKAIKETIKQEPAIAPLWGENTEIGAGIVTSSQNDNSSMLLGSGSFR